MALRGAKLTVGVRSEVKESSSVEEEDAFELVLNVHTSPSVTIFLFAPFQLTSETNLLGIKNTGRVFDPPSLSPPPDVTPLFAHVEIFVVEAGSNNIN